MRPVLVEDLSPFFADKCRLSVILAREAQRAVILRRGPSQWWRLTLWDTHADTFTGGQWFHGRIYPGKCDISPDGLLLLYFAAQFWRRGSYRETWTAVSKPPYLTALALWPWAGTWGGGGVFIDRKAVLLNCNAPFQHHPDHPPGNLRVHHHTAETPEGVPSFAEGWETVPMPDESTRLTKWRKPCGNLILACDGPVDFDGPPRRAGYTLLRPNGAPVAAFEAHWADWDQRGRLVAAVGGRILAGKLTKARKLVWRQLVDLHEEKFEPIEAPQWAQRW